MTDDFIVTHNTTTMVEAIRRIPPNQKVLAVAFNKSIRDELKERLQGYQNVSVRTLNQHGFFAVARAWAPVSFAKDDRDAESEDLARFKSITDAAKVPQPIRPWLRLTGAEKADFATLAVRRDLVGVDEDTLRGMNQKKADDLIEKAWNVHVMPWNKHLSHLKQLIELCRAMMAVTPDAIMEVQHEFRLLESAKVRRHLGYWPSGQEKFEWELEGWTYYDPRNGETYGPADVHRWVIETLRAALRRPADGRIARADCVFPVAMIDRIMPDVFQWVFVDETQDMDPSQLRMVQKSRAENGRIVVIGDDRQCHPAGVLVRTSSGDVPIETLKDGDEVMAWDHREQWMLGCRHAMVASRPFRGAMYTLRAAERDVPMTGGHKLFVQWAEYYDGACATYLAWCEARGFRAGFCALRDVSNIPHADKAWILDVHGTLADAVAYGNIVTARYGVPVVELDGSVDRASNRASGLAALRGHGREFDYPFMPCPIASDGTVTDAGRDETFSCYAANVIPRWMRVPLPDDVGEWAMVESVSHADYDGTVYSLDVSLNHTYAANGVVVGNSIYRFRGADTKAIPRMKRELNATEFPLNESFRVPKCAARYAKQIVDDFTVPDDTPEGTCETVSAKFMMRNWRDGDFVISYTNAPLAPLALLAVTEGHNVLGLGMGKLSKTLVNIVRNVSRKASKVTDTPSFLKAMQDYYKVASQAALEDEERKMERENKRRSRNDQIDREELPEMPQLVELRFAMEAIEQLASRCKTFDELESRVSMISMSVKRGERVSGKLLAGKLVFTTVHKIKGAEANTTWIIDETFRFQGQMDRGVPVVQGADKMTDSEIQEHVNLRYVAITRVKNERDERGVPTTPGRLFFVRNVAEIIGDHYKLADDEDES